MNFNFKEKYEDNGREGEGGVILDGSPNLTVLTAKHTDSKVKRREKRGRPQGGHSEGTGPHRPSPKTWLYNSDWSPQWVMKLILAHSDPGRMTLWHILPKQHRRSLANLGLGDVLKRDLPSIWVMKSLLTKPMFGYCYACAVSGIWRLLIVAEQGRTPRACDVATSRVLALAYAHGQIFPVGAEPGSVAHIYRSSRGSPPREVFVSLGTTLVGGDSDVADEAANAATLYAEELHKSTLVGAIVFPTYNDQAKQIVMSDLDEAVLDNHVINWSSRWARIKGTHSFHMDGDEGMALWTIVTDPRYHDFVLETVEEGMCYLGVITDSDMRDGLRELGAYPTIEELAQHPVFLRAVVRGVVDFSARVTRIGPTDFHVDPEGETTFGDLFTDHSVQKSNLGGQAPRCRPPRMIRQRIDQQYANSLIAGWLWATATSVLVGTWALNRPKVAEGRCYTLLHNIDLGKYPLVSDYVAATRDSPANECRVSLSIKDDCVHLEPTKLGRSSLAVYSQLKDGVITIGDLEVVLSKTTRIGGAAPSSHRDDDDELAIANCEYIGPTSETTSEMNSSDIEYTMQSTQETLMAARDGGVFGVISAAAIASAPQRVGMCYRLICPVYLGARPLITDFLRESEGMPARTLQVSVTLNNRTVHLEQTNDGVRAQTILDKLRCGVLLVDGAEVPIHESWRIGGRAFYAAVAATMVVPVWIFHNRARLDNIPQGFCYRLVTPTDLGYCPLVTEFVIAAKDKCNNGTRVKISGSTDLLHLVEDPDGLAAEEVVALLELGYVYLNGKLEPLNKDCRIGMVNQHHATVGLLAANSVVLLLSHQILKAWNNDHVEIILGLFAICVVLSAVAASAAGDRRRRSLTFFTFGSRGDRQAAEYYAKKYSGYGLDVAVQHTTPGTSGDMLLAATEEKRGVLPSKMLGIAQAQVAQAVQDGGIVLAPQCGALVPGAITYSVSAEKSTRQALNVSEYETLNRLFDSVFGSSQIPIESLWWCAPRTPDGETLLTRRKNLGLRKNLICLGSSQNCKEPDLPWETTWSTSKESKYRHEPRTDHAMVFAEYEHVYCHGGVGTMRTAQAAGCVAHSLSDTLDRSPVPGVERRLMFHDQWEIFSFWLLYAGDASTRNILLPTLIASARVHWKILLSLEYIVLNVWLIVGMATCASWYMLSLTPVFITSGFSWVKLAVPLIIQGRPNRVTQVVTKETASFALRQLFKRHTVREVFGWFSHKIVDHVDAYSRQNFAVKVVAARYGFGPLPTSTIMLGLEFTVNSMLIAIGLAIENEDAMIDLFRCYMETEMGDDGVYWAQDPMHLGALGDLFKLRHVELVNSVTNESLRVIMDDNYKVSATTTSRQTVEGARFFKLPIPLSRWDSLRNRVLKTDGTVYGPHNNCQTITMAAILEYIQLDTFKSIVFIVSAFLLLAYSFVAMVIFIIIAGVAILIYSASGMEGFKDLAAKLMPRIAFAGAVISEFDVNIYVSMVRSIVDYCDGFLILDDVSKYPATEVSRGRLLPTSLRLMKFQIGNTTMLGLPPCSGLDAPGKLAHRNPEALHTLNAIEMSAGIMRYTAKQVCAIARIKRWCQKRKGKIAVITSPHGIVDDKILADAREMGLTVLLLVNKPGTPGYFLDVSDEALFNLRCHLPIMKKVQWVNLPNTLSHDLARGYEFYINQLQAGTHHFYVSGQGFRVCNPMLCTYSKCISSPFNLDIHGAWEPSTTSVQLTGYVAKNFLLWHLVRKETDVPCDRNLRLYDKHGRVTSAFNVKRWSHSTLLDGVRDAVVPESIEMTDAGVELNGAVVNLAPIVSEMYPEGTSVEMVIEDAKVNTSAFFKKVDDTVRSIWKKAEKHPLTEDIVRTFNEISEAMSRSHRHKTKKGWAPVHEELRSHRVEALKTQLHSNPVFIRADFDTTMSHYVKHLNMFQHDKTKILSPTEYRRRVNRNPYVDTYLKERLSDAHNSGLDASVIATRTVMLESLARYNKAGVADAMTDGDCRDIARVIYERNPDMFSDAIIADPYKLSKKFLSFRKYSAGLPFTFEGSGIKTRADLKRAGWLRPIAEIAMLPYKTGEWYPAIAHSFPKSQVVKRNKIAENPAKMRTIVATAGFNNVQQGVLNFDLNNRHDYLGTHEKVGMPLLGSHMSYIFEDLERFTNAYSLDVTAMDANLCDGVLRTIANIRKLGFKDHPSADVLSKHIDCAMEQTKFSYVINLITDTHEAIKDGGMRDIVEKWSADKNDWAIKHKWAPGGVLRKECGGSTGDSNVTFNNTKGLPIIVMYCYCKATGIPYVDFFDKVALHNFGDDDVIGTNEGPETLRKMVKIAQDDLNVTMRFESSGTSILDQTFLGCMPRDPTPYISDFQNAGINAPRYAIVKDEEVIKMRLASEKAEMSRHKGIRHELYRLEKAAGYALLTAHLPDLYDEVANYHSVVVERIRKECPNMVDAKWFKKKHKLPSYNDVIRKWYRPLSEKDFSGVHRLQLEVSKITQTEAGLIRFGRLLGKICDACPSHLLTLESSANAYRVSELYTGIFEAHAWHHFVKKHGETPTSTELQRMLDVGPYSQFCNAPFWLRTVGAGLPTSGALFERNMAHATWMLLLYTMVYMQTNQMVGLLSNVPFGNVLVEAFNLHVYKSRKVFGTMSYVHYMATGENSPIIDALVPHDPYAYHKRAAAIAMSLLPKFGFLGYVPIHKLENVIKSCTQAMAKTKNLCLTADGDLGNSDKKEWRNAVETAKFHLFNGATPLLVAHTGTGKTREIPGLVLADQELKPSCVIVVMPRVIVCEQYAKSSGALFKKRGTSRKSALMTCTYGYLNHCIANDAQWWDECAFFIFDEAHEESCDWYQLRKSFIPNNPRVMTMSATPESATCKGFTPVLVAAPPKFPIEDLESESMETAIATHAPNANRFLVVEPSLRRCRKIAANLMATGYPVKVVHAGDRDIPDGVHIVATSVVESSITIPGCDLVIDTGERYVNDGGDLRRVPNDPAGSVQRRGRTGRTNPGRYVRLTKPIDQAFKPVPDVNTVLAKSRAVNALKISVPFDEIAGERSIKVDKYARIDGTIPEDTNDISIIHLLRNAGVDDNDLESAYERVRNGRIVDQIDHLMIAGEVEKPMLPFTIAINEYSKARIRYHVDGSCVGDKVYFKNNRLTTCFVNFPINGGRPHKNGNNKEEARADNLIEHGTSTPRKRQSKRLRPPRNIRRRGDTFKTSR